MRKTIKYYIARFYELAKQAEEINENLDRRFKQLFIKLDRVIGNQLDLEQVVEPSMDYLGKGKLLKHQP